MNIRAKTICKLNGIMNLTISETSYSNGLWNLLNATLFQAECLYALFIAPPSVPQNLCVIEVSKDYALLSWEPPKYDGGEKISGYEIEKSLDGMVFVSAGFVDSTVLRHKLMRLKEGAEYVFRVSAENKIGLGDPAILEKPVVCKLPFGEHKKIGS